MRRLFNNIISVFYSTVRFLLFKLLHGSRFSFQLPERFSPNVVIEFNKGCKVHFGKRVRVHSGSKIKVRKGASLCIEDDVRINYNCMIVCHNEICIEKGTEFGPNVYLYDHDHDYRVGLSQNQFITEPIHIGKDCWIGANTIILRGTSIGDNCVVGAGSVIKGNYPNNSVIIQKRITETRTIQMEESC